MCPTRPTPLPPDGASLQNVTDSQIVLSFFTFLILYNNLVPISLYVSLDMIKVCACALRVWRVWRVDGTLSL